MTKPAHLLTSLLTPPAWQFEPWTPHGPASSQYCAYDKPWIVTGDDSLPTGQEFYITCSDENCSGFRYFRSVNGGESWYSDYIYRFGQQTDKVLGNMAQPAVCRDGPLYIAYRPSADSTESAGGAGSESDAGAESVAPAIRFLRGVDLGNDPNSAVYFEPLYTAPGVELVVQLIVESVGALLPGELLGATIPQLVAIPTNANGLFLVYHDRDPMLLGDVNVYLRVLTRDPSGYWSAGEPIRVNQDDDVPGNFDQFTPSPAVDANGWLHVLFYDDRDYPDQGDDETHPKFNMYWAYTRDQGQTWHEEILPGPPENPNEPALNWDEVLGEFGLDPREYNGTTCFGSRVWNAYTGTWAADAQENKSVVASHHIQY